MTRVEIYRSLILQLYCVVLDFFFIMLLLTFAVLFNYLNSLPNLYYNYYFLVHLDINECASEPCQNGGSCYDEIDGFECECPQLWDGELCTISKILVCVTSHHTYKFTNYIGYFFIGFCHYRLEFFVKQ